MTRVFLKELNFRFQFLGVTAFLILLLPTACGFPTALPRRVCVTPPPITAMRGCSPAWQSDHSRLHSNSYIDLDLDPRAWLHCICLFYLVTILSYVGCSCLFCWDFMRFYCISLKRNKAGFTLHVLMPNFDLLPTYIFLLINKLPAYVDTTCLTTWKRK